MGVAGGERGAQDGDLDTLEQQPGQGGGGLQLAVLAVPAPVPARVTC